MQGHSNLQLASAFVAAFIAGSINSVAGGGSILSFPVLIALGIPPLIANATNTVGLWPGAIGSLLGFREEFKLIPKSNYWLLIPALLGSAFGAYLLRHTSAETFEHIVPGLIFFSTIMFVIAPAVRKRLALNSTGENQSRFAKLFLVVILQLGVSIYGGYFGAGMSILMLSILSIMGMTDMLVMAAMTSFLSLAINGMAGGIFAASGLIDWPYAIVMMIGATSGGYGAAGIARKVGSLWIRRLVITVGLILAIVMLVRII